MDDWEKMFLYLLVLYQTAAAIGIVGIAGNVMAFIGFQKQSTKTSTSLLFQALAIADSLVLITACPYKALIAYENYNIVRRPDSYVSSLYPYAIWIGYPLAEMAILASINVTLLLALTRLIAVCFPLHARRLCTIARVRWYLAFTITFAILYNIPHIVANEVNTDEYGSHFDTRQNHEYYFHPFVEICRPVVYCAIPLLLLTLITTALIIKLISLDKRRAQMTRAQRQSNNTTRVLIAVLVVFFLCSLPFPLAILLRQYSSSLFWTFTYVMESTSFFYILNSSVNFLIYTTLSKQYRRVILQSCCSYPPSNNNAINIRTRYRQAPGRDIELQATAGDSELKSKCRDLTTINIELKPRGRDVAVQDIETALTGTDTTAQDIELKP